MRKLPVLLLNALRPAPETSLSNRSRFVSPNVFVQIDTVAAGLVNNELHFMGVMYGRFAPFNLGDEIRRCNLALADSHMAHFWTIKVYAIANCVYSLLTDHAHGSINQNVSERIRASGVACGRGASKRRQQHQQVKLERVSLPC